METEKVVKEWFRKWEKGDFDHLPVTENFNPKCPLGFAGRVIYSIRSVTSPTRHSELW
jgi:hypothetical protein